MIYDRSQWRRVIHMRLVVVVVSFVHYSLNVSDEITDGIHAELL